MRTSFGVRFTLLMVRRRRGFASSSGSALAFQPGEVSLSPSQLVVEAPQRLDGVGHRVRRRRDLSFDGVLSSTQARLDRTHEGHMTSAGRPGDPRVELGPRGTRPDENGVDLDQELVTAHRNAGAFVDQANVLARLSTLVRTAIGQS